MYSRLEPQYAQPISKSTSAVILFSSSVVVPTCHATFSNLYFLPHLGQYSLLASTKETYATAKPLNAQAIEIIPKTEPTEVEPSNKNEQTTHIENTIPTMPNKNNTNRGLTPCF